MWVALHWCLSDVHDTQGYRARIDQHYRRAVEIDLPDSLCKQKLEGWLANKSSRQKSDHSEPNDRATSRQGNLSFASTCHPQRSWFPAFTELAL